MENENNRHYPFGRKEAEGFAQRGVHDINHVECPEMPPGLLSMEPIGATKSSPYMPQPASAGEKPRR
jgi:hypothetical protein